MDKQGCVKSSVQVYIVNSVELAMDLVNQHELKHTLKYKGLYIRKGFGETDVFASSHRVRWETADIPFMGVPFFLLSEKVLECQHAKCRYRHQHIKSGKEQNKNEANPVGGQFCLKQRCSRKKLDCPAKIKMVEIVTFPDLIIDEMSTDYARRKVVAKVREGLKADNINYERRFVVALPDVGEHKNHFVGQLQQSLTTVQTTTTTTTTTVPYNNIVIGCNSESSSQHDDANVLEKCGIQLFQQSLYPDQTTPMPCENLVIEGNNYLYSSQHGDVTVSEKCVFDNDLRRSEKSLAELFGEPSVDKDTEDLLNGLTQSLMGCGESVKIETAVQNLLQSFGNLPQLMSQDFRDSVPNLFGAEQSMLKLSSYAIDGLFYVFPIWVSYDNQSFFYVRCFESGQFIGFFSGAGKFFVENILNDIDPTSRIIFCHIFNEWDVHAQFTHRMASGSCCKGTEIRTVFDRLTTGRKMAIQNTLAMAFSIMSQNQSAFPGFCVYAQKSSRGHKSKDQRFLFHHGIGGDDSWNKAKDAHFGNRDNSFKLDLTYVMHYISSDMSIEQQFLLLSCLPNFHRWLCTGKLGVKKNEYFLEHGNSPRNKILKNIIKLIENGQSLGEMEKDEVLLILKLVASTRYKCEKDEMGTIISKKRIMNKPRKPQLAISDVLAAFDIPEEEFAEISSSKSLIRWTANECKDDIRNTLSAFEELIDKNNDNINLLRGFSKFCERAQSYPLPKLENALHNFGLQQSTSLKIASSASLKRAKRGKINVHSEATKRLKTEGTNNIKVKSRTTPTKTKQSKRVSLKKEIVEEK